MVRDFFHRLFRRRRRFDRARIAARLGPGVELHGTLRGEDDICFAGRGGGNAQVAGSFVLADGAYWHGNITAAHVAILGEVHGNVSARDQIEIAASGRIHGHIRSPVIAIAEGAVHAGEVRMAKRTRIVRFDERRGVEAKKGD